MVYRLKVLLNVKESKLQELLRAQDDLGPFLIINEENFDQNLSHVKKLQGSYKKDFRVATKSIRIPYFIEKAAKELDAGLMCFHPFELDFWHQRGQKDLFLAYPFIQKQSLKLFQKLVEDGADIKIAIDHPEHLEIIKEHYQSETPLPVVLDIDLSYYLAGVKLGAYRSYCSDFNKVKELLELIKKYPMVKLVGAMTYEAHVASIHDKSPFDGLLGPVKKVLRQKAIKDVTQKRKKLAKLFKDLDLEFLNAGGSSTLEFSHSDPLVTELTIGSGLFCSHLFDYFLNSKYKEAIYFALPVTRKPADNIITCQSGGYIASGEVGKNKEPVVAFNKDLTPISIEGFGEVQTPFKTTENYKLGDYVFLRPAKAGESNERFKECFSYKAESLDKHKTYRGFGLFLG
jgi:D-serine deaminase-like pyridoxal phosphate-dependent protein